MERYLRLDAPPPAVGSWAVPPPGGGIGAGVDAHHTVLAGEALRSAQAGYWGLINHLDDQIYWLVAEFVARSRKMGRPWIVLLTSDHGEMLGDHYYFRKCEPYEGSSRIPLLIQGSPELGFTPGTECAQPVCLEDLMPTLLELANVPLPNGVDGVSLVPVLRGEQVSLRPYLHGEHAPCYGQDQAYHFLTDGRKKYVWRPWDGSEQIFDLAHDPQELHDRSTECSEELAFWRRCLVALLANRPEGFVDGETLVVGRPYDAVLPHAKKGP